MAIQSPALGNITATVTAGDIEIGAVEIKNPTDDTRATVGANGLYTDVRASALPTGAATSALQTQPGVDIGDVTVNNSTGAAAVNIQDGGNSITVDQGTATNLKAEVIGTKTNNAAVPGATNLGALPGIANAAAPTWTETYLVAESMDLSGNQRTTLGTLISGEDQTNDLLKVGGNIASAGTDVGNPVKIGGVYNTTQPTVTTGQRVDLQSTARGELMVSPGVSTFAVQSTNQANSGVDIGDVTINNSTGVNAVNIQDGGNTITVDGAVTNTVLSVVGTGTEAAAQRVTIASDSTGLLSVDDNGGALTVDNAGTFAVQAAATLNAETTKVIGVVRNSDGAGNLLTSNSTTPSGKYSLDVNINSILGTAPTTVGKLDIKTVDTVTTLTGGGVANNAADSGNPVKVGGIYNATAPVLDTADRGDLQLDVNGNVQSNLRTLISGEDQTNDVLKTEHQFSYAYCTADTAVKAAAGFLHSLTFAQTDAAPTAGTIIVYDNTAESGTIVYSETFDTTVFRGYTVTLDVKMNTGIYVGFTTTADVGCTVSYR